MAVAACRARWLPTKSPISTGRTVCFSPQFVDGTFYTADELVAQHLLSKRAESLGHQSVGGEAGTLERLRGIGSRIIFTHLNNSNPMLEPSSAASQEIREAGAEIAYDGMELLL